MSLKVSIASVIIPVYSRKEWIGKCLTRLTEQRCDHAFEVLVVDDGSPNEDQMRKTVEAYGSSGKCLIRFLRANHGGPAAARNYGVKYSSGDILCFLDDDSLPEQDWLREIMQSFQKSRSTGIVSGNTLSFDRSSQLPLILERSVYPKKSWATCNIAYRREVFNALGGFDECYGEPSWEDNDLGFRAMWEGYKHVYNDRAIVYHPHERTIDEFKNKCLLNGRGAATFTKKHLRTRPLWALVTPIVMARYMAFACLPSIWKKDQASSYYVRFLWSKYSLLGYRSVLSRDDYDKNKES